MPARKESASFSIYTLEEVTNDGCSSLTNKKKITRNTVLEITAPAFA